MHIRHEKQVMGNLIVNARMSGGSIPPRGTSKLVRVANSFYTS